MSSPLIIVDKLVQLFLSKKNTTDICLTIPNLYVLFGFNPDIKLQCIDAKKDMFPLGLWLFL